MGLAMQLNFRATLITIGVSTEDNISDEAKAKK